MALQDPAGGRNYDADLCYRERRIVRVPVTVELLGCLFTDTAPGGPPRGLYVVSGGVPPDAACVGAFVPNDDPRTVCLIYAHPTFPAVPTGSVVPRVTPTCRAKETPPEVSFEDARYVRGRWFPGEEAPA